MDAPSNHDLRDEMLRQHSQIEALTAAVSLLLGVVTNNVADRDSFVRSCLAGLEKRLEQMPSSGTTFDDVHADRVREAFHNLIEPGRPR